MRILNFRRFRSSSVSSVPLNIFSGMPVELSTGDSVPFMAIAIDRRLNGTDIDAMYTPIDHAKREIVV